MEEEEEAPMQRPGRLLPLKPLQISEPPPRRRLSQSWTENLEESSTSDVQKSPSTDNQKSPSIDTQRSPLQKVAAFFSDPISPITKVGKMQKQQSLDTSKPKKGERRESIKDHLLKFKQKAGRVLEEVHERLSEEHSSAVAPLVPSPSSRPGTDPIESDDQSGSERVVSPTLSVASKKTVSSAELKASLRSKIRKQAEKVVERTRGSVQLTKRLQRRLTVHNEESFTEEEVKNVDEQIESSLKMGEKFMAQQPPSNALTDEEQFLFFTGKYEERLEDIGKIDSELSYLAAVPGKEEDPRMFILYETEENDVENRGAFPVSSLTRKRFPTAVWTDQLGVNQIIERKFKWNTPEDEICSYLPAQTAEVRQAEEEQRSLLQMTVTIQSLAIVNHELCSVEEGIAASLRHTYWEQVALFEKGASLVQQIEESENSKTSKQWMKNFAKLQKDLESGAENLRQQWNALEASRAAQGFNLSTLRYNPEGSKENSYYGTITEDVTVKEASSLPQETQEKLKGKNNTSIRMALYFNDILVARTPPRGLGNYNLNYGEIFNLQVKSIPQKLHIMIIQRFYGKESDIARIEIKIPWTRDTPQPAIPFQEFNEKDTANRMRGFLVTKVDWTPPESMEREKEAENTARTSDEPFSLIPAQCRLVSDEEFEGNLRWELLERRYQRKLPKSLESKPIGIDSSEIDPSLVMNEERTQYSSGFRTGIDGHRALGSGYAARIRTKLLERRNDAERRITYEEVVKETPLPTGIGGIGSLFGPVDTSRKLKPMRMENGRQQASAQSGTKLLINIQSAMNLPERRGTTGALQPLVEVQFQGNTMKTTCAVGKHPNWQQCLSLPLDIEHISDLKTVVDHLHIDIYDQLVAPLPKDDREPNTVHEQLIYRFIGTVRIPFSTVYCRGRIDGGLRLQTPLFITGYTISEKPAYIKVLIALDPPLSAPKTSSLPDETAEPEKISQQCDIWLKTNREQFDDRRFTALVNDINGKHVLACRFLRPLKPPPSLDPITASKKGLEKVAKVVSFIPFLADPLLFPGHLDLWTTIDQFVSYGCGDEEEHAILLCCWLLGNRINSYLVLGSALPDGEKAAFVLTDLHDSTVLINPSDGSVYQVDDPMCPLVSVGCIVSSENIFANIQPRLHPCQLHFDFSKTNDWRPLFPKPEPEIVSIQPSAISYQEVTEDAVIELRSSIERELKLRFDEARPFAIPQWNLMASRLLREMLNEDNWTQNVIDERFHRLRDSYNIFATAVKIPYKSLQKCVEEILSLKIHLNTETNVQFGLGVHIQPYFNNIVGCSLALAVLTPKK